MNNNMFGSTSVLLNRMVHDNDLPESLLQKDLVPKTYKPELPAWLRNDAFNIEKVRKQKEVKNVK
jgi:hypothetical protein